jgi:hypothetical protein
VVAREPLDEIPSPPQRPQAQEADGKAADEERQRERWVDDGHGDGERQHNRCQAEIPVFLAAQLPDPGLGVLNGSRIHRTTNCGF